MKYKIQFYRQLSTSSIYDGINQFYCMQSNINYSNMTPN